MRFPSRIRLLLNPWLLVVVGIAFNIFSAVITNYFIDINNQEIHVLEDEVSSIELRINSFWQTRQDIERKRDAFLLLLQSRDDPVAPDKNRNQAVVYAYVQAFLTKLIEDYGLNGQAFDTDNILSAQNMIEITEQAKQKIIARIDDIYLEKIILDKRKQPIASRNSTLMSLALFLQLVGLILVLARDLQWRKR